MFVNNQIDNLFFGSCNRHDACYRRFNSPSSPCKTFGTKFQCDFLFLADLEGACAVYAGLLLYPASGWADADDFFDDCSVVAGAFYTGVVVGGGDAFRCAQCLLGCNESMCNSLLFVPYQAPPCPNPGCASSQNPPPGPLPCTTGATQTRTWMVGPNGAVAPLPEQLEFDLRRSETRPSGQIFQEEWAVVSTGQSRSYRQRSSQDRFGMRAASAMTASLPAHTREGTVLIVEAAVHELNGREIPTPSVVPFEVQLERDRFHGGPEVWFRAEVNLAGTVDRLSLLNSFDDEAGRSIREAIRENLSLQYSDERRHRVVVFGLAKIDERGRIVVGGNGLVTVPQCCCDDGPCAARPAGSSAEEEHRH